jgi:hypothetical protein
VQDFQQQLTSMMNSFLDRQTAGTRQELAPQDYDELWKQYDNLKAYQTDLYKEQAHTVNWVNQAASEVYQFKSRVEEAYSAHVAETSA